MEFNWVKDKVVALLLIDKEDDSNMHVYIGRITESGKDFKFINEIKNWNIAIDDRQMERLTEVSEGMKEIFLNADYYISMMVENLPDEQTKDYNFTGLIF